MERKILSFQTWCSRAASHIRFKGHRPAVEQELLEHMEDRFDALLAEGMPARDAERAVLAAMGDTDETGAALARVHKPYLGWLYVAAKWLAALSAVLAFFSSFGAELSAQYPGFSEPFATLSTESDADYTREIAYLYPEGTAVCNGYAFSIPVATHRRVIWTDEQSVLQTYESVYFVLEAAHPLPWAGFPEGMRNSLYAVDSEGNLYPNRNQKNSLNEDAEREVCGNADGRTLLRYRYEMWISALDPAAEWVELRYARLGCSFALRIDLAEGGGEA